jgi:hypothetical protein
VAPLVIFLISTWLPLKILKVKIPPPLQTLEVKKFDYAWKSVRGFCPSFFTFGVFKVACEIILLAFGLFQII